MADSNISAPPVRANALQDEIANQDTLERMCPAVDGVYAELVAIAYMLEYLNDDLESKFALKRGKRDGNGGVSFMFRESRIDSTMWMSAEIWNRVMDLKERVTKIQDDLDTAQ